MLTLHEPGPRLFTKDEYLRVAELGTFDREHVQLIRGVIVTRSPVGVAHGVALMKLNELLVGAYAGKTAFVRIQQPFATSDSMPEPDVACVPRRSELSAHPSRALLVIEVSDSSLAFDRTTKSEIYAEAGIPEYWIVDLQHGNVEVRTNPRGTTYTSSRILEPADRLRVPGTKRFVRVGDILPTRRKPKAR